jgi:hypothetical protein
MSSHQNAERERANARRIRQSLCAMPGFSTSKPVPLEQPSLITVCSLSRRHCANVVWGTFVLLPTAAVVSICPCGVMRLSLKYVLWVCGDLSPSASSDLEDMRSRLILTHTA